jgi:tRNA threonylcarbamoyladenosine biosynthesis protein TsaB
MRILALDSCSRAGSVALLENDSLVVSYVLDVTARHSERLLPAMDRCLVEAGWTMGEVDLIACTGGPGSFTGLRIGLATAKGLAFATGIPLVGVNSLEATAQGYAHAAVTICAMIDARKRQVFAAQFRPDGQGGVERLTEDVSTPADQYAAALSGDCLFVGDGAALFAEKIRAARPGAILAPAALATPRAAAVAWLGARAFARGETGLTPHYVRPTDAEMDPRFANKGG